MNRNEKNEKKTTKTKTHVLSSFQSLGFRDSGTTYIWFFIENMFLEIMCFRVFFLFRSLFDKLK